MKIRRTLREKTESRYRLVIEMLGDGLRDCVGVKGSEQVPLPEMWCLGAGAGGKGQRESTRTCRELGCLRDILHGIEFL